MLGVTFFGLFFTPVFYVVIRWLTGRGADATAPPVKSSDEMAVPAVAAKGDGPAGTKDGAGTDIQVRPLHHG
jgi:hypothetical protein